MTFAEFSTSVRASVFPEGEAENLVANHRKYIIDALIDIQQKVPCQQIRHRDSYGQDAVYFDYGASVFEAPRGFITGLHTLLAANCCERVDYSPVDEDTMRCYLSDQLNCGRLYVPTGYYTAYDVDYEYGYNQECQIYADSAIDKACRAGTGIFSLIRGQIYVYPHIQSTENAVIEWDGIKRAWDDSDEVVFDREVQDTVELYLERKSARREDCDADKTLGAAQEYNEKIAQLIWQCRKERRLVPRAHCFSNCSPFC